MSWNKHGSPYDPNHRGKNRLKMQVETAYGEHPSEAVEVRLTDFVRSRQSMLDAMIRDNLGWGGGSHRGTSSLPSSYTDARDAVKEWICPAPEQAFDDIVGNATALQMLRDAIQAPAQHKDLFQAYGMSMPKGALLYGPPGCGKTMFARAAAAEMKRLYGGTAEFLAISGTELQAFYVGGTEQRIKAIFAFAREYKAHHGVPLLIFLDEAEALLPDRTGRGRYVHAHEQNQVATFLAEMDGMRESGAFILLASNRPDAIDQAILRDGRCDFKIRIERPNADAVEAILRKSFKDVLVGTDPVETLIFAAVESLFDPHKIIAHAHAIAARIDKSEFQCAGHKHFLLEHIVSGAMAASIPNRAKRHAFARDKATGKPSGVTVADVVAAVNDVFDENKGLDHSFAMQDFMKEFVEEAKDRVAGGGWRMKSRVHPGAGSRARDRHE